MFSELKKTMDKEIKDIRKTMYEQHKNINKDINYEKEPNQNSGGENYDNWNENSL